MRFPIRRSNRPSPSSLVLGLLAAWIVLVLLSAHPALAADIVATVTRVQGVIQARGMSTPRILGSGDTLQEGDTVITGAAARAELTFTDGSVLTLSDETEFTVERFDRDRKSARFALLQGAFRSVTGAIAQGGEPDFEVRTPLATIGIRGTDFWGGFFSASNFGVFMISGKGVYVYNQAGRHEITKPGQGITVRSASDAPASPITWGSEKVKRAFKTVTFD